MKFSKKLLGLAAVSALALSSATANAVPYIWISDGAGNVISVVDGDANDTATNAGEISLTLNNWNGWSLAVTSATGYPSFGTASAPDNHLTVVGGGIGTLFVVYYDTGDGYYTPSTFNWFAEAGGALTSGASIDWGVCAGVFAAGQCNFGAFGNLINGADILGQMSGFGNLSGVSTQASNYYTAIFATLTHTVRGTSSADLALRVPEPGSLALLGLGLLGIGVVRRRR